MIKSNLRNTQPQINNIGEIKLQQPKKHTLENGIPVYLIDAGTQELSRIELVFDAGSFYQSQPLQAYFTNKCLKEGTESYTSKSIAETFDFYGAYLKANIEKDQANISLYSLNKHLEKLLPMLYEVVLKPTFPDDEVQVIVKKQRQEYLVNLEKVSFIAGRKFSGLIFGKNHPYGRIAKMEDYQNIDNEILKKYFEERYCGTEFTIIVSGKMPEGILKKLNQYFGKHTINKKPDSAQTANIKPATQLSHFIEKEGTLQSALRLGKPMFNKLHPDYLKFKVLNTILGGYFGSRLMTNIREDKGYTYGIGSGIASFRHGGMFYIASEVGTEVTQKALDEIFIEIDKLHSALVSEEELNLVKNYMAGNFMRSADGPFALAELFKGVYHYNLEMDFYSEYLKTIKTITTEEIRDLAVNYLQPESLIRLVVGKDRIMG